MISGAGAMNPVCPREDGHLEWGNGVVSMLFDTAGDSPVRLCNVAQSDGGIACRVEQHGNHAIAPFEMPVLTGTYGVHCTGTAYHLRLLNRVQIPPDH